MPGPEGFKDLDAMSAPTAMPEVPALDLDTTDIESILNEIE